MQGTSVVDQGLPATRRRLLVRKPGRLRDEVQLVTEPMPSPSDGEVAVRMKHLGINGGHDTWQGLSQNMCATALNHICCLMPCGMRQRASTVSVAVHHMDV